MWLRTLLFVVLIVLVLRAVMRLMDGIRQGIASGSTRAGAAARPPVKMMADPMCGTFVVPGKALQLAKGGQTHYFCSEKCRDQWAASH